MYSVLSIAHLPYMFFCVQGLKLSSYLFQFHTVPSSARCCSTMAAVSGPLNYINGQRVEASNSNTEDDITVLEPATGFLYAANQLPHLS